MANQRVPPLEANTRLLFFLPPHAVSDDLLHRYRTWLSPSERQRLRRLCFARHQREYLLGRALVRYVVGTYTDLAPAEVVFYQNDFGKPYIDPRFAISFNLSHSAGVNVLAVARGGGVGGGIEKI